MSIRPGLTEAAPPLLGVAGDSLPALLLLREAGVTGLELSAASARGV